MAHAILSPSSAGRWMSCPGSVALTKDLPDDGSSYAAEGTVAHEVAARCLTGNVDAASMIGWDITAEGRTWKVDADMAMHVQTYVGYVRALRDATQGELMVEQRLPIGQYTGEHDAHGTSDAVILAGDELIVVDLKFGRGVAVDAEENPQLQIYALGALDEFGLVGDFKQVRMVIHQPRLGVVSEWVQSVADLAAFGEQVKEAANKATDFMGCVGTGVVSDADWREMLNPSEKACKFCKAKATCPALREQVLDTFEAVQPPDQADPAILADALAQVGLIEDWCKAVRAEAERRLLAGEQVPGFKLVQGKRGARQWGDAEAAERLLRDTFRLKVEEAYDLKLISPTSAEKLHKAGAIGPRQWPKVVELITQPEGKPSVAPESDKRPALNPQPNADGLDVIVQEPACDLA